MRKLGLFISFVLSVSATATQAQDACDAAADKQDLAAILTQCNETAVSGDAHANYLMGYATLATKTTFFKPAVDDKPRLFSGLKYSTDELIALGDAKDYLKRAAEQGHIGASGLLGSAILETMFAAQKGSVDISAETDKAFRYLKFAADGGDKPSVMHLADASVIYAFDQPNKVTSVNLEYETYLRAVVADPELNSPYWQNRLRDFETFNSKVQAMQNDISSAPAEDVLRQAEMMRYSEDPEEVKQGNTMLLQLSEKGVGDATYLLATSLAKSAGKDKALAMMEKAAAQKNHKAMLWLGDYHGCKNSPKVALDWYKKAKAAGNKDADFGINEIKQYGNVSDCG